MKNINIIGLCGLAGVGKDTAADCIQDLYPGKFKRYAFADPMREACAVMFGFSQHQMSDRVLKEVEDPVYGFSPRTALQFLGTEFGRNMLSSDVWLKRAGFEYNKAEAEGRGLIITDVRFENEARWLADQPNSLLIHVKAPGFCGPTGGHASEMGVRILWGSDLVVVNDKSLGIEALRENLKALMSKE